MAVVEIIATGRTVEEAIENGCQELGCNRDDVSVEILEMHSKKLFKTIPAKVKITRLDVEIPQESAAPEAPAPQPAAPAAPAAQPQTQPQAARPAPQGVMPVEEEEPIDIDTNPAVQRAVAYLSDIFAAAGAGQLQISAVKQGDAALLRLEGEDVAQVMDIKGDIIQALSYLTDRAVNKGIDKKESEYLRLRLDVAGYRNRREGELVYLAEKVGKEVNRTHRSRTLEPMNAYERLIVHTTISKMEGLVSESIGSDVQRRVVIKSTAPDATEGEDWRPPRKGGGGHGHGGQGGNRRGGGGRPRQGGSGRKGGGYQQQRGPSTPEREFASRPRPENNEGPTIPQPRKTLSDGDDLPLYGKIEL